ncbi:hypothetical protein [Mangrovicoccus ximenensis]|uniref:hypothetical protein n=1 Tax=Mangrovicoccus ximenensis TaxID=1911570 RepID=UPI000D366FE6|nr:hypothetical protein [Mangrovicoccus ximenensis]
MARAVQVTEISRAQDDADLAILDMVRCGWSFGQIATATGKTRNAVSGIVCGVRRQDLKFSGEPRDAVLAGYRA